MELVFHSTKYFEKEIKKFSKEDQSKIISKLNDCSQLLLSDPKKFFRKANLVHNLVLVNGWQPSLYNLRIPRNIRIILSVDEDPIFERVIITLFRVVRADEINKAIKSLAESLYQGLMTQELEGEDNGSN